MAGTNFEPPAPREPPYAVDAKWRCRCCTHLRVHVRAEYPYPRMLLACAAGGMFVPVGECDDFVREPGVD